MRFVSAIGAAVVWWINHAPRSFALAVVGGGLLVAHWAIGCLLFPATRPAIESRANPTSWEAMSVSGVKPKRYYHGLPGVIQLLGESSNRRIDPAAQKWKQEQLEKLIAIENNWPTRQDLKVDVAKAFAPVPLPSILRRGSAKQLPCEEAPRKAK